MPARLATFCCSGFSLPRSPRSAADARLSRAHRPRGRPRPACSASSDEAELSAALAQFEQQTGDQIVVVDPAIAPGPADRGLRLPARPPLGHRPEGQEQRRAPDRRARRARGADRGRLRPRGRAHRCAEPQIIETDITAALSPGDFAAGSRPASPAMIERAGRHLRSGPAARSSRPGSANARRRPGHLIL